MTVPYTFAGATAAIPLSQLDSNFNTAITLGNTAVYLGNTTTSIGNLTLANVTISSVSTAITAAQGGTGLTSPGTSGNVLTSNGSTWTSTAPAASVSLSANNTWTGAQSFTGTSSVVATVLTNAAEVATVSATAATGTINYDVTTQSVLYYTSNASANWTVNFRGSSGTSLNTLMSTGQSITAAFLVTQGSTAYYNNAVTIDGTSVTPKYQGGTAWSAGNASAVDAYVYTIVKTGSAAFTVFASQTKFA